MVERLLRKIAPLRRDTSIRAAALVLAAATLASRLAGFVRDRLLSGAFGAGHELDAYYAAFRTPDFVYNLFVLGAITAGFIPVFAASLAKDGVEPGGSGLGEESNGLASALLTVLGAVLAVLAAFGVFAAPWVVWLLTPGFDAAQSALTVELTRIMFVSPFFLGLSSVLGGILQTKRRFFVYAFAPIMYNVGIIVGTVTLAPTMGIRGPAIGVALGAFAHFLAQAFACRAAGFRFRPRWQPAHAGVVSIAKMSVPRIASLAVGQVNLFILVGMASTLGAGGIAVFTLANNLQNLPVGILGVSFAVAAFPLISELAAKNRDKELIAQFSRTSRTVLFLVIPATVLLLTLRAQIVRVVLGSGRFDWSDTITTANTLAFFTLSLFAQALYPLVVRVFFAYHDAKTPLYTAITAVVVERIVAWQLLSHGMGAEGLALAFSIGSILDLALLWVLLRHRTGDLGERGMMKSLAQISVAGVAMAVAIQAVKPFVAAMVDMQTGVGIFTQGLAAGVAGIAVYAVAAALMGSEEMRDVVRVYSRRAAPTPVSHITQDEETIVAE